MERGGQLRPETTMPAMRQLDATGQNRPAAPLHPIARDKSNILVPICRNDDMGSYLSTMKMRGAAEPRPATGGRSSIASKANLSPFEPPVIAA